MLKECTTCQQIIQEKVDGDSISSQQNDFYKRHIATCTDCARFEKDIVKIMQSSQLLSQLQYKRPIVIEPLTIRNRGLRLNPVWGVASILLFVVAGYSGWYIGQSKEHVSIQQQSLAVQSVAQTHGAQAFRLVVPAQQAQSVEVTGDFSQWKEKIPLQPVGNGLWVKEINLEPGRYQYVIIIDGVKRVPDPSASQIVDDGFGGKNSIVTIGHNSI